MDDLRTELELPSEVRVGFRTYRVIEHKHDIAGPNGAAVGLHRGTSNEMHVSSAQPAREIANTLLHEILHAVWDVYSLGDTEHNDEESIVNALANGLCGVIRENPGLADWFADVLED